MADSADIDDLKKKLQEVEDLKRQLKEAIRNEKEKKKIVEPDFEILSVKKFESDDSSYEVTIDHQGKKESVIVSHASWYSIGLFRRAFHAKTERLLAPIKKEKWEEMIAVVKVKVVATAPETSIKGMILDTVENLTHDAKDLELDNLGTGKSFMLKDDDAYYLRTSTLALRLPAGVPVKRQFIGTVLAEALWESKQIETPSGSRPRFWVLKHQEKKNGKVHVEAPKNPDADDLF